MQALQRDKRKIFKSIEKDKCQSKQNCRNKYVFYERKKLFNISIYFVHGSSPNLLFGFSLIQTGLNFVYTFDD